MIDCKSIYGDNPLYESCRLNERNPGPSKPEMSASGFDVPSKSILVGYLFGSF